MPQPRTPSPISADTAVWPVLPVLALGALTTCRLFLASGLDLAPGDLGAARIMLFLLESRWRALHLAVGACYYDAAGGRWRSQRRSRCVKPRSADEVFLLLFLQKKKALPASF